jgi:hypothetical protein
MALTLKAVTRISRGTVVRPVPSSNLASRFLKPSSNASSSPGPPFVSGLGMRKCRLLPARGHRSRQALELSGNAKAGARLGPLGPND